MKPSKPLGIAALGLSHEHIFGQINLLLSQGAVLQGFYDADPIAVKEFGRKYPDAHFYPSAQALLADSKVDVVATAAVPDQRAGIGEAALKSGKHVFSDKPGFVDHAQIHRVRNACEQTGRRFFVYYQMRKSPVVQEALRRIRSGAIGEIVQIISVVPHRCMESTRPEWFFRPLQAGSVLVDIGTHLMDLQMQIAECETVEIRHARMDCVRFKHHEGFFDFGELVCCFGNRISGVIRADWLTPDGLGAHGDGRSLILGSEGYIDLRISIELGGRKGKGHLFVVTHDASEAYSGEDFPASDFAANLYADFIDGGERSMTQQGVFRTAEAILCAERMALSEMKALEAVRQ